MSDMTKVTMGAKGPMGEVGLVGLGVEASLSNLETESNSDSGSPSTLGTDFSKTPREEISKTPLRLSLGSRDRIIPGFENMDCDPHEGVKHVGDVSDLSRFTDRSVEAIYASHVFEHFPHPQAPSVLKEWARVLRPGGILYIAVPDFARAVQIYVGRGMSPWIRNWICGDQGYKTAFHYSIYDATSLKAMLKEAGFSDVTRCGDFPLETPQNDCSTLVSTADGLPLSLNLIAIKGSSKK